MSKLYSIPKLVKYADLSKTWYVYFRYQGKIIKRTADMNRIAFYVEREKYGNAVAKALLKKLKDGWNPLIPEYEGMAGGEMNFYSAMEFALNEKQKNISEESYNNYKSTLGFIKIAVSDLGFGSLTIKETTRTHVKLVLNKMKDNRKWSNKAYNKAMNHLKIFFTELVEWEIVPYSPIHKLKELKVQNTRANIPPDTNEYERIKEAIINHNPGFWRFLLLIENCGIRPVEITRLKVYMISFERKEIILPSEITKTGIERVVPLSNTMLLILAEHTQKAKSNDYIFGSYRRAAKGNVMRGDAQDYHDFICAPTQLKRDTATKRWERIVKTGLGLDVNMYSLKKYGANSMIMAGVPLDALQELYGHTSHLTTEIYAQEVRQVRRNKLMEYQNRKGGK